MPDPAVALLLFAVVAALCVALLWPRTGLVARLRRLAHLDERVRLGEAHDALESDLGDLNQLESELLDVQVPLSYMEEFYHLRLHLGYVRQRLRDRLDYNGDTPPNG